MKCLTKDNIMKVLYNDDNDELWCVECKCRINIGEKYIQVTEGEGEDSYKKCYHLPCVPEMEEDE